MRIHGQTLLVAIPNLSPVMVITATLILMAGRHHLPSASPRSHHPHRYWGTQVCNSTSYISSLPAVDGQH